MKPIFKAMDVLSFPRIVYIKLYFIIIYNTYKINITL